MKFIVQYEHETFKEALDAHNNDYVDFLNSKEQAEQLAESEGEKNYKIYKIEEVY